jgi:hypothetical protein
VKVRDPRQLSLSAVLGIPKTARALPVPAALSTKESPPSSRRAIRPHPPGIKLAVGCWNCGEGARIVCGLEA